MRRSGSVRNPIRWQPRHRPAALHPVPVTTLVNGRGSIEPFAVRFGKSPLLGIHPTRTCRRSPRCAQDLLATETAVHLPPHGDLYELCPADRSAAATRRCCLSNRAREASTGGGVEEPGCSLVKLNRLVCHARKESSVLEISKLRETCPDLRPIRCKLGDSIDIYIKNHRNPIRRCSC